VSLGEVELAKVVGNLLDDALLHGQSPLKVRVNRAGLIDQTGRAVARLEVEDSGPGMDPHLLATATRRFTRAAESRSRPASASDWLLDRHGRCIAARSSSGVAPSKPKNSR
jgi:signal transduction histidine kinase